jgi:predicted RNA polymerase sigma factor
VDYPIRDILFHPTKSWMFAAGDNSTIYVYQQDNVRGKAKVEEESEEEEEEDEPEEEEEDIDIDD